MNYSYAKANFNRYAGESKSDMVGVSFYVKQDLPYGFYTAGRLGLSNISSKVERELFHGSETTSSPSRQAAGRFWSRTP